MNNISLNNLYSSNKYWNTSGDNIITTNSGNLGIGTLTPAVKLHIFGNTTTDGGSLIEYPKQNMSSGSLLYTDTSITVEVKASTFTTGSDAWRAFDGIKDSDGWISKSTTLSYPIGGGGSTYSSRTGYNGEWLMIDLGESIILQQIKLYSTSTPSTKKPKTFKIFASNTPAVYSQSYGDGTGINNINWVEIYDGADPSPVTTVSTTYIIPNNVDYRYYAIVVNTIYTTATTDNCQIVELELFGGVGGGQLISTNAIGIGTSTPAYNLHVNGTVGISNTLAVAGETKLLRKLEIFEATTGTSHNSIASSIFLNRASALGNSSIVFANKSTAANYGYINFNDTSANANLLKIGTAGTGVGNFVNITSGSGFIGINKDTPSVALDVNGDINSTGIYKITQTTTGTSHSSTIGSIFLDRASALGNSSIVFANKSTAANYGYINFNDTSANANLLKIGTAGTGVGNFVNITSGSGFIGINKDTPSVALDVNGDINSTGIYKITQTSTGIGHSSTVGSIFLDRVSASGNSSIVFANKSTADNYGYINFNDTSANANLLKIGTAGTGVGNVVNITSGSGFVGINKDDPAVALDVDGDINSTGIYKITQTSTGIGHSSTVGSIFLDRVSAAGNSSIVFANKSTADNYGYINFNDTSTTSNLLKIGTAGTGAGNFVNINSGSGFVGINNDTPAAALDVNGDIKCSGTISASLLSSVTVAASTFSEPTTASPSNCTTSKTDVIAGEDIYMGFYLTDASLVGTCTITFANDTYCDILLVGGGGGGGNNTGGGGGGGQVIYAKNAFVKAASYSLTIGKYGVAGGAGGDTIGFGATAKGGGGGSTGTLAANGRLGNNGGSGSGAGAGNTTSITLVVEGGLTLSATITTVSGTNLLNGNCSVYGNRGGHNGLNTIGAGGGGGAGGTGENATSSAGNGGDGILCDIRNSQEYYGAGGGGGRNAALSGGLGGSSGLNGAGGRGGYTGTTGGTAGSNNYGSGGGGGLTTAGGNGGSGCIIIRYKIKKNIINEIQKMEPVINKNTNYTVNKLSIYDNGRIGKFNNLSDIIPLSKLYIYEEIGSIPEAVSGRGTIVLAHGDSGGTSSIVFKSGTDEVSDFGYISYRDSSTTSDKTGNKSRLTIATGNDTVAINQDDIILMPSGNVGIGTEIPAAKLDVNGKIMYSTDYITSTPTYSATGNMSAITSISGTNDYYVIITNTGTLTIPITMYCDILIVGGGGAGGITIGGGGGGGAVFYAQNVKIPNNTYAITIGGSGANTVAFGITAIAGGSGGSTGNIGNNGGSGGGASSSSTIDPILSTIKEGGLVSNSTIATDSFISMQNNTFSIYGNKGGCSGIRPFPSGTNHSSGGGGGAGMNGINGSTSTSVRANGGDGFACDITGTPVYYGAGGGGAANTSGISGNGGLGGGGGGAGGTSASSGGGSALNSGAVGSTGTSTGGAGGANTGSGGGGSTSATASSGGSGVVIIRWKKNVDISSTLNNLEPIISKTKNYSVNKLTIYDNGKLGPGALNVPTSKLHIYEDYGTIPTPINGTIVLEHGDQGGTSSIVFKSKGNAGSDYGYISYRDNIFINDKGITENSRLIIGTSNDNSDHIALMPSGNVGIGTETPAAKLHVNGDTSVTGALSILNDSVSMATFKHTNLTQGIGIGYNAITAVGTNATQDVSIISKSTGAIRLNCNGNDTVVVDNVKTTFNVGTGSGEGIIIRGTNPTLYLRHSNGNKSAMIHCNGNNLYFLSGDADSTTWAQVNSAWPLQINLTNNNCTFGGTVTAATFSGNATSASSVTWANVSDKPSLASSDHNHNDSYANIGGSTGINFSIRQIYINGGWWIGQRNYMRDEHPSYNLSSWIPGGTEYDLVFSRGSDVGTAYIKSDNNIDEIDFTGQHGLHSLNMEIKKNIGYIAIVSSEGYFDKNMEYSYKNQKRYISINESLPLIELSNKKNDKRVIGVISDKRQDFNVTVLRHCIKEETAIVINSIGEGAIWVSNINGNIENGDYITSSDIPGIGMRQDDDILHNYSVCKITMNCDFNPKWIPVMKTSKNTSNILNSDGSNLINQNCFKYDDNIVIFEQELDSNNELLYEWEYEMKYITLDGTIIDKYRYDILMTSNLPVYKMAFVGCTYHCG